MLDACTQLVYVFGICDGDLEVGALLVPLEHEQILSEHHLHRVNGGLMLRKLCFEVSLVSIDILSLKIYRCRNV